ncbi:MAG: PQQ-binding-like beta-propeller repeat protein, partial [Thermomicrobiales bacterium]
DPAQPPTALLRRPIAPGPDTPVSAPGPVVPMRGGDAARSGSQPGPAPAAQPQEAWRAPTGWYSPAQLAAARGLVVFGGFSLGGRQAVVEALDAGQGGVRWQTTAPVGWAEIPDTPALAGDLLFVPVQAPVAGIMAVVAWTGQPVWFAPFGFTSVTAPAADGDTVYTAGWGMRDPRDAAQGDSVGSVFALDQRTGRERWRFLDAARFGPLAVGRDRVYVSSNRGLFALAKQSGQKQWQARFTPLIGEAPVVIGDAVVFAGTDITSGATGVYALDAATGALHWRQDLPAAVSIGAGTAAAGDTVYVAWWETPTDEDAKAPSLSAYDLATGEERWVYRATLPPDDLAQATAATMGAPVIAGDRVLFGVSVQTDGGSPSAANGLYAVDAASGALVWQAGGLAIASSPAVIGEWVYVMGGAAGGQSGGSVIALHP